MEKVKIEEEKDVQELPVLQPMEEDEVNQIEMILHYKFTNKSFLDEAFTHASCLYQPKKAGKSYRRLEFVGDSVLGCLIARHLFSSYRDSSPGQLTLLKAANVDTERLARIAVRSNLHHFIRHNAPHLERQIEEFLVGMNEYPIHSTGLLYPPKALADVIESVIGAIFIDSNSSLETVWKVFKNLAEPLITLDTLGKHPMSELYELCQKNRLNVYFEKQEWINSMTVEVFIEGNLYGSATCGDKKEVAQNRAAKIAIDKLMSEL